MTITLDTLAIGDVNYVSKHNSNYAVIKSAIDALQASLTAQTGAVTNYPSFALAMAGAFVAKMQETDAVATDAGSAMLDISAGTVFHPSDSSMRTGALTTLDFTGQASDTYFTHLDKIGTWTFDTTGIDTVHTIVFTSPSTFTTLTEPVDGRARAIAAHARAARRAGLGVGLHGEPVGRQVARHRGLGDRVVAVGRLRSAVVGVPRDPPAPHGPPAARR